LSSATPDRPMHAKRTRRFVNQGMVGWRSSHAWASGR
jgi:hypothetical protein